MLEMKIFEPPTDENSKDLTSEEIESAIPVENVNVMIERLNQYNPIEITKHALRCRDHIHYGRVDLKSSEGPVQVVFRLDWLTPTTPKEPSPEEISQKEV